MRRERRSGPLLVLLPAALLALFAAVFLRRPEVPHEVAPPAVSDPDGTVAALGGHLDGADGSRLVARLAPLHADPERQAFEARSLQSRLNLDAGGPWRLSLRWDAPGTRPGGGLETAPTLAALGLGPIEVHDEGGAALAPIPPDPARASGAAVADPLRTLLAPPRGSLSRGQAVDWVLWGRAPGEGARLVGLLPPPGPDADAFAASTGLRGPLALESKPVRRSEMLLPMARLDRAAPAPEPGREGKNTEGPSSEDSREARGTED